MSRFGGYSTKRDVSEYLDNDAIHEIERFDEETDIIMKAFDRIDVDQNEDLDFNELSNGFKKMGIHFNEHEMKNVFKLMVDDSTEYVFKGDFYMFLMCPFKTPQMNRLQQIILFKINEQIKRNKLNMNRKKRELLMLIQLKNTLKFNHSIQYLNDACYKMILQKMIHHLGNKIILQKCYQSLDPIRQKIVRNSVKNILSNNKYSTGTINSNILSNESIQNESKQPNSNYYFDAASAEMRDFNTQKIILYEAFCKIDVEQDEDITLDEFTDGLQQFGIKLSKTEIKAVFCVMDYDKSNYIDEHDFYDFFIRRFKSPQLIRLQENILYPINAKTSDTNIKQKQMGLIGIKKLKNISMFTDTIQYLNDQQHNVLLQNVIEYLGYQKILEICYKLLKEEHQLDTRSYVDIILSSNNWSFTIKNDSNNKGSYSLIELPDELSSNNWSFTIKNDSNNKGSTSLIELPDELLSNIMVYCNKMQVLSLKDCCYKLAILSFNVMISFPIKISAVNNKYYCKKHTIFSKKLSNYLKLRNATQCQVPSDECFCNQYRFNATTKLYVIH